VYRIDEETEQVTPLRLHDGRFVPGEMPVAVDDTSVWVAAGTNVVLTQLDPGSGETLREVPLPLIEGAFRLAVDEERALVSDFANGSYVLVDLASGDVLRYAPIFMASAVALQDGTPWLTSYQPGRLYRLGRNDGRITDTYTFGAHPMSLFPDRDLLWQAGNRDARLTRIETESGDIRSLDPERFGATTSVALFDGRVFGTTDVAGGTALVEFDRDTLEPLAAKRAPEWFGPVVAGTRSLWINGPPGVYRFDLAEGGGE
jgi:hypothetical protein